MAPVQWGVSAAAISMIEPAEPWVLGNALKNAPEEDIFNPSGRFPGIWRAVRVTNIRDHSLAVVSASFTASSKGPR
jgi:hypothetical protein